MAFICVALVRENMEMDIGISSRDEACKDNASVTMALGYTGISNKEVLSLQTTMAWPDTVRLAVALRCARDIYWTRRRGEGRLPASVRENPRPKGYQDCTTDLNTLRSPVMMLSWFCLCWRLILHRQVDKRP